MLEWTKEPPKVAGFYRHRFRGDRDELVEVDDLGMARDVHGGTNHAWYSVGVFCGPRLHGEWLGPLPAPREGGSDA